MGGLAATVGVVAKGAKAVSAQSLPANKNNARPERTHLFIFPLIF
jgi:hypothetical protein